MKRLFIVITSQVLWGLLGFSQTQLRLNDKIARSIQVDLQHTYTIELMQGEFALLNVVQKGIDLVIDTYTQDGKLIESIDTPNGSNGDEMVWIDANETATYYLKIYPLGERKREKSGDYTISYISLEQDIKAHLDQVFTSLNDRGFIPGFIVNIVDTEKTLYSNAQGYANLDERIPYTSGTMQQIESISKTCIGLSIMMLVEAGKLNLDTNINEYLPFTVSNPYFPNSPITLRHLATHTAAINDGKNYNKAYWIENKEVLERNTYIHPSINREMKSLLKNKEMSLEAYLTQFFTPKTNLYSKKNFFKRPSGKKWYYSNIGAALAAYIVEVVSGESYDVFVSKHIFKPLRMYHTSWGYTPDKQLETTLKYGANNTEYPRVKGATYPEGGIYSNSIDLHKYLMHWIRAGIGKGALLTHASYQELMKVQYTEEQGRFKGIKNGLLWWHISEGRMGHNGGSYGSSCNMYFYPKWGIGYTSFENIMRGESIHITAQSKLIEKVLLRYMSYFAIKK